MYKYQNLYYIAACIKGKISQDFLLMWEKFEIDIQFLIFAYSNLSKVFQVMVINPTTRKEFFFFYFRLGFPANFVMLFHKNKVKRIYAQLF